MAPLTRTERAVWLRMLAYETRTDATALKAQRVIVRTMDGARQTEGHWCACPYHDEALDGVLSFLWRERSS